jgi:hypothetical protein
LELPEHPHRLRQGERQQAPAGREYQPTRQPDFEDFHQATPGACGSKGIVITSQRMA